MDRSNRKNSLKNPAAVYGHGVGETLVVVCREARPVIVLHRKSAFAVIFGIAVPFEGKVIWRMTTVFVYHILQI
jgi:hypothetical protein